MLFIVFKYLVYNVVYNVVVDFLHKSYLILFRPKHVTYCAVIGYLVM